MELSTFVSKYKNKNKLPLPENHGQAVEASNAIKIHAEGARPQYYVNNLLVTPETFKPKYRDLFATRLLNRHPNEAQGHYNWRLSVYSPVSKELFDKFMHLCKGAILQPNNYTIQADDNTMAWMMDETPHDTLEDILDFAMQNPKGYMAVIHEGEVEVNEQAKPEIVCIEAEDVLMYDYESFAFKYEGRIFFLNATTQYEIDLKKGTYIEYVHNFGEMPVWDIENSYTQPFQFWSDLLVRNMNDDEAVTKHYSYPKVQQVESSCPRCLGQKKITDPNCTNMSDPMSCLIDCSDCNGRGYITNNPGDYITIAEETIIKNGGNMPDYAKFITPDVGIPEFHMKRWQTFYERVEQSLYLRQVTTGVQSGDAKKEDRKDQYFFLQSVSNFIFENYRKGLKYVQMYLNPTGVPVPITIIMPKQFDLMSDSDLVNEMANLQAKTDDAQTLGEINYMVNSKIFRDDPLQKKISDVLYFADVLYGISGDALRLKYISGIYTDTDKIIHEKGYKILVNIAKDMTQDVFVEADINTLIQRLIAQVQTMLPQGVYSDVPMGSTGTDNALKSSVGGLTGMIEIAKAVASGLYDLEAAVALVSDRFGVTEEEARRQLGTPSIQGQTALDKVTQLV